MSDEFASFRRRAPRRSDWPRGDVRGVAGAAALRRLPGRSGDVAERRRGRCRAATSARAVRSEKRRKRRISPRRTALVRQLAFPTRLTRRGSSAAQPINHVLVGGRGSSFKRGISHGKTRFRFPRSASDESAGSDGAPPRAHGAPRRRAGRGRRRVRPPRGPEILTGGFNQTWLVNCLRRRWLLATLMGLLIGAPPRPCC